MIGELGVLTIPSASGGPGAGLGPGWCSHGGPPMFRYMRATHAPPSPLDAYGGRWDLCPTDFGELAIGSAALAYFRGGDLRARGGLVRRPVF